MTRELKIDRAIYLVNDETRTYSFFARNPDWEKLDPSENENNKREIDGFIRLLKNGRKVIFQNKQNS